MALTQWQLKPVATDTIASGDFVAFTDEGESGDPINKLTVDNLMETGLPLVTEDTIAVASDYILFLDGGATGNTNKEQFADVMTAIAGTGLSASSGVINVDASQTGITSVGALDAGSITSNFGTINNGASTITTTGSLQVRTIDYSDGDLAITIADGGGTTFAQNAFWADQKKVVIGSASAATINAQSAAMQLVGSSAPYVRYQVVNFSNDAEKPQLQFAKSRAASLSAFNSTPVILNDNDKIGEIAWFGDDGTDMEPVLAQFYVEVDDGTPAANGMGTAFVWQNNTVAGSLTENMRLSAAGDLSIGLANKMMFDIDGGGDTYIYQESADDLHIVVGNAIMVAIDQDSTNIGIGNATDVVADTMVSVNGAFSHGSPGAFQVEAALTTTSAGTAAKHFLVGGSGSSITTNFAGTAVGGRISTAEFFEPNITLGTSDTLTLATTLFVNSAPTEGVTNAAIYVAGGNVIIGSGSTAAANQYSKLVIAEDNYSRIELINPADKVGTLWFSDATEGMGRVEYSHSSDSMEIRTNQIIAMIIDSTQSVYIGVDAAGHSNGNMTTGLTINQAATDDQILAFKSSDVAHGITGITETDTYFYMQKLTGTLGGVRLASLVDDGAISVQFDSFAVDINTTKTASGRSNFEIACGVKSGTGIVSSGTNANLFSVHDYGGYTAKFIVDQEGDFFYDGSGTAYDSYDDASLTRAMAVATGGRDIIRDEWDKYVDYNENDLVKAGVLGDTVANGGLVNGAAMQRLHTGAIWQLNTKHMSLAEKVDELEVELIEAKKQLAAISA